MLIIKKYANGRYYNTTDKKYIKAQDIVAMSKKKKKIKIVAAKTGRDITKATITQLSKKQDNNKSGNEKSVSADNVKKWFKDNMDLEKQIDKILVRMNLPSREQVIKLKTNIESLNKKIADLKKLQAKKISDLKKEQDKRVDALKKIQKAMSRKLEQNA